MYIEIPIFYELIFLEHDPNYSYDPIRQCFAAGFFSQSAIALPNGAYQSLLDQKYTKQKKRKKETQLAFIFHF